MAKSRCRLCGGKLAGSRCTFCGLDNTCYDRDYTYQKALSRQRRVERKVENHTPARPAQAASAPPPRSPQPSAPRSAPAAAPRPAYRPSSVPSPKRRNGAAKISVIIIIIFIFVSVLASALPALEEAAGSLFSANTYSSLYSDGYDWDDDDWDPYGFVTREIPETGEAYETVIGPGIYQIGIHIPEGVYHAELLSGEGGVDITDNENSIYDYTYFGTDEEYDEVTGLDDIRLYSGAELNIDSSMLIRLSTENAQPLTEQPYAAETDGTYRLPEGEYTAGTDGLPEGIYDISVDTDPDEPYGYANIILLYPDGSSEYFWADSPESAVSIDGYSSAGVKNVVIPDGTEVSVEYGDILLTPGQGCYNVDYDSYPQQ